MTAGNWIALYAAITATTAIAWQVATHLTQRRPKLRVQIALMYFVSGESEVEATARDLETIYRRGWRLQADTLNVGHSEVRVSRAAFETLRGPSGVQKWTSSEWGLPSVIQPGEERVMFLTDDDAGELKAGQEFVAEVITTRGKTFRSDVLEVSPGGRGSSLVMMPYKVATELAERSGVTVFTMEVHEFGRQAPDT